MDTFEKGALREVLGIGITLVALLGYFLVNRTSDSSSQNASASSTGSSNAVAAMPVAAQASKDKVSEGEIAKLEIESANVEQLLAKGGEAFKTNCKQCHAWNEAVVGPALGNVLDRKDVNWLINFIKYPEKTIKSGDEYAVKLYEEYQQYMPNHDFLTDEDIKGILTYVSAFD